MLRAPLRVMGRIPWWIWAISVVAIVPRLLLVPFGLPYELDPDEHLFVDAAWHMVEDGIGDPAWYNVPASTLMDIMAAAYAAIAGIGALTGQVDPVGTAGDAYRSDVTGFFAIGRLVTAVSGLGVVLMTYAVAREVRVSRFWASVAGMLIAVSFAMIQFSALIRPDMLMIAFLLATVLVSLRALSHPSGRAFALAGVFLGLAAASKYTGALAVVPIVAANVALTVEARITPRRGLLWLAASAAAGAIAALLVGPFLFLNLDQTIWAIGQEARSTHLGATGGGLFSDLWRYLTEAMVWGLGTVAATIGVAGMMVMLLARRPRIIAITFWVLLLFLSFLSLWWLRWALPLLPFGALGAVFLADRLQRGVEARVPAAATRTAAVIVAVLLVWPLVQPTLRQVSAHVDGDHTSLHAIEWIGANVPPGATLLVDSYSTQVSVDDYDVRMVYQGEMIPWTEFSPKARPDGYFGRLGGQWFGSPDELIAAIEAADVDYIALSDIWIELFRAEVDTYPDVLPRYQAILDTYPQVARFDNETSSLGSPVTILAGPGAPGTGGG